ncbi:hypothetical protein FRB97_003483 [Tulasnella sp. 331]|nr:hypothetical protein FRB97_003483 [Tulasnella sp. 331]
MELRKSEVETGWKAALWPKSKYCRAYLLTVIAETVIDMAIEAAILQQLDMLGQTVPSQDKTEVATNQSRQPIYLGIFVLAHFLQMILAVDAVYNKNTLQFLFLAVFNFVLLAYGAMQIVEVQGNINDLVAAGATLPSIPVHALIYFVPCVIAVAEVAYIGLGYQIWKEFGWKVYKFLGADRNIKKLYSQYQVFQCLLKFDIFFWVGFSVQWMVLIPIEQFELWATVAALPLAILLLIEGYLAARHENKWMMGSFMLGCVVGCVYFAWKIFQNKESETYLHVWKSLLIFACVSIVLLFLTFVSATVVLLNFNRGLKENMNKKEKQHRLERRATAYKGSGKGGGRTPPVDLPDPPPSTHQLTIIIAMDTLPLELISDVLERAVLDTSGKDQRSNPQSNYQRGRQSLTLSHINQHLRRIAIGTPKIWSSIEVVAYAGGTPASRHDALLANLARSRNCDIGVLVDGTALGANEVAKCMLALGQHTSRWSSITFRGDAVVHQPEPATPVVKALAAALRMAPAHRLRFLHASERKKSGRSVGQVDLGLGGANLLTSLSVKHVGVEWCSISSVLLEDLNLEGLGEMKGPSVNAFVNVLASSPRLRTLCIHDLVTDEDDATVFSSRKAIDLPVLTNLELEGVSLPLTHYLLTHIDAQGLQRARLSVGDFPQEYDWTNLSRCLGGVMHVEWCRQREGLARMTEVQAVRVGLLFEALVNHIPKATHVSVSHDDQAIRYCIHGMENGGSNSTIMPELVSLRCHAVKGLSLAELRSFLAKRAASNLPMLKRLSISALDFSITVSTGRATLERQDEALALLRGAVDELVITDTADNDGFRYTFFGWRDYQSYLRAGRVREYMQEMDE